MPTVEIEITKEQADELSRGGSVTITQPKPERSKELHVLVSQMSDGGLVYETRGPLSDAEWRILRPWDSAEVNNYPNYSPRRRYDFTKDIAKGSYAVVPLRVRVKR